VDVFAELKARLDLREVATRYGVQVNKHGKALCPFHREATASFSIKGQQWRCFGACGIGGDVLDLVSQITGTSLLDAARRLSDEYGLDLFSDRSLSAKERKELKQATQQRETDTKLVQALEDWANWAYDVLCFRYRQNDTDKWVEYLADTLQEAFDDFSKLISFYKQYERIVIWIESYIKGTGYEGFAGRRAM